MARWMTTIFASSDSGDKPTIFSSREAFIFILLKPAAYAKKALTKAHKIIRMNAESLIDWREIYQKMHAIF